MSIENLKFGNANESSTQLIVDIGNYSVKCALLGGNHTGAKLLQLGREGKTAIPSSLYIPTSGPVIIGDDAELHSLRDPTGSVRNLIGNLDKTSIRIRNGREFTNADLLKALVSGLLEEIQRNQKAQIDPKNVVLLCRPTCSLAAIRVFTVAFNAAGIEQVQVVTAPVAIASNQSLWPETNPRYCVVVDIGAHDTDISVVEMKDNRYRQSLVVEELQSQGCELVERLLWDTVCDQIDEDEIPTKEFTEIRKQLRQIKEAFSSYRRESELLNVSVNAVKVNSQTHSDVLKHFYAEIFSRLPNLRDAISNFADADTIPLVLAGGGANLSAIADAPKEYGWTGPIVIPRQPELAAINGVHVFCKDPAKCCPECNKECTAGMETCESCGFPFSLV